jgi:predicted aspartyl protease
LVPNFNSKSTFFSNIHSNSYSHFDYFGDIKELIFNTNEDKRPRTTVEILGNSISGLLDSGASCTVLGKGALEFANRLGLCVFEKENASIRTADGT